MADKTTTIIFKGNISGIASAVTTLEGRFKKLGASINSATSGLTSKLTGIAIGGTIVKMAHDMVRLDQSVRAFGKDANMSAAQMVSIRSKALQMSMQTGASTESILGLGQGLYSMGKDMNFVNANLGLGVKIMQATGASAGEVGDAMSDLNDDLGLTGKGMEDFFDKLVSFAGQAGVEGNVRQLFAGGKFKQAIRQAKFALGKNATAENVGGYLTTQMFVGTDVNLRKAYSKLSSPAVLKNLKKIDKTLDVKKVVTLPRALEAMFKGVDRATAMSRLTSVFGAQASSMVKLYDEYENYQKALKATGSLNKQAAIEAESLQASMVRLDAVAKQIAVDFILPSLEKFSRWVRNASGGDINKLIKQIEGLVKVFITLAGVVAAIKIASAIGGFAASFKGGGGGAAGAGAAGLGGLGRGSTPMNPMYVAIVGMPPTVPGGAPGLPGMGGGKGAGGGFFKGVAGKGVIGGAGALLGPMAIAGIATYAGYQIVNGISQAITGRGFEANIVNLFTGGMIKASEQAGLHKATAEDPAVIAIRNKMRAQKASAAGSSVYTNTNNIEVKITTELDGVSLANALKGKQATSRGDQTPNMRGEKK